MAAKCSAMTAEHETMMVDMKVADERLDALVVKMNVASGSQRVDAIAGVVTEMITQRQAMPDGMMKMQHVMMEHMQSGGDPSPSNAKWIMHRTTWALSRLKKQE